MELILNKRNLEKALIVLLISTCCTVLISAQNLKESEVPSSAKAAFNKKYPDTHARWEKEKDNYEVTFEKDGKTMSAAISKTGNIIETETGLNVNKLPPDIQSYLKTNYTNKKVKESAKIEKANGDINYEAEVNGKDLIFDNNGKSIKIVRH